MSIREDSKKIIRHFLEKAIENGNLLAQFSVDFKALAEDLSFESAGYCRVCCQYLRDSGRILLTPQKNETPSLITLNASAIDFLEST